MKKSQLFLNPFIWIAGGKALLAGAAGWVLSVALATCSGVHANGLLQYGPVGVELAWYSYAVEYLVIWLVPALLFYVGGQALSRSHVRVIDVAGTVLMAQVPLVLGNFIYLLPPVQQLLRQDFSRLRPEELLAAPGTMTGIYLLLLAFLSVVWMVVWMVNALKVTCNLKGWKWGVLAAAGIVAGDVLSRLLISWWRQCLL